MAKLMFLMTGKCRGRSFIPFHYIVEKLLKEDEHVDMQMHKTILDEKKELVTYARIGGS
jgi:hypothetical protein